MPPHPLTAHVIADEAALRALLGEPTPLVCAKVADRLVSRTRRGDHPGGATSST